MEIAGLSFPRIRGMFRGLRSSAALLACALTLAGAQGISPVDEYVLKAQALVELTPFFRWPDPRDAGRPFTILVVGRSMFESKLDTYARTRTVQGRRIEVRYVSRRSDLFPCDLLFICRSERRSAGEILEWARGKGVLTVADDEDLLKRGVMVDLLTESGLLRLYLNARVATAEHFVVGSQLLRLARPVD